MGLESERAAGSAESALVWAADLVHNGAAGEPDVRVKCVAEAACALGLECVHHPMLTGSGGAAGQSEALLRAAHTAAELGCRRVVWSVQFAFVGGEPNLDHVASAVDRAMLVSRLASLDVWDRPEIAVPEVRIETPLVDLSDEQIADLALDLSVPLGTLWWLHGTGAVADAERARWAALLGLESGSAQKKGPSVVARA